MNPQKQEVKIGDVLNSLLADSRNLKAKAKMAEASVMSLFADNNTQDSRLNIIEQQIESLTVTLEKLTVMVTPSDDKEKKAPKKADKKGVIPKVTPVTS